VVRENDSRSKGCGFESRLIQNTRWKWDQSHARIDVEKIKKIQVAKWGTPKKEKKKEEKNSTYVYLSVKG